MAQVSKDMGEQVHNGYEDEGGLLIFMKRETVVAYRDDTRETADKRGIVSMWVDLYDMANEILKNEQELLRLAAYEDTGLTPEQIASMKSDLNAALLERCEGAEGDVPKRKCCDNCGETRMCSQFCRGWIPKEINK